MISVHWYFFNSNLPDIQNSLTDLKSFARTRTGKDLLMCMSEFNCNTYDVEDRVLGLVEGICSMLAAGVDVGCIWPLRNRTEADKNNSLLAFNTKEGQYAYHVLQTLRTSVSGNMVSCQSDGADMPVYASVSGGRRTVVLSGKEIESSKSLKINMMSSLSGRKVTVSSYSPTWDNIIRLSARKVTPVVDTEGNDIYVTLEPGTFMLVRIE